MAAAAGSEVKTAWTDSRLGAGQLMLSGNGCRMDTCSPDLSAPRASLRRGNPEKQRGNNGNNGNNNNKNHDDGDVDDDEGDGDGVDDDDEGDGDGDGDNDDSDSNRVSVCPLQRGQVVLVLQVLVDGWEKGTGISTGAVMEL
ncbi:uncharacterized protein UV8b_07856 [Ustilaginoidea virens]|uniref:Uncharacterized protein n=1 Tax=Ustilaginoidea virens TaxID=1159556 RepID=A0A8E5HXT2_USTVR|nr:uncharacterized protein UV8b_07856 [Ustilaginoidea virens]QUC23615.1 hypothetical protein UV8b_07856 [Ustilaginoidea virens]